MDAFEGHKTQSIENPTVLAGFLAIPQNGLGLGWGWAGLCWGLQTVSQQSGCSFRHPAAAARSCGSGQWGRSQI